MLHNLAASVPRGAILLIEDIDCAFPSRDADSDDDEDDLPIPTLSARPMGRSVQSARMAVRRQVTMSGLLARGGRSARQRQAISWRRRRD
jgi:hypothetical protein